MKRDLSDAICQFRIVEHACDEAELQRLIRR